MVQIYPWNDRNFTSNGTPMDCLTLEFRASINGTWTIEGRVSDKDKEKISDQAVIKAYTPDGYQLFRIRQIDKSDYDCSFVAWPIAMDLANIVIRDRRPTDTTGQGAIDALLQGTDFTGHSDISTISTAYWQMMNIIECINGDIDQSFINRWGGEISFNNFDVYINSRIGADNGMRVH